MKKLYRSKTDRRVAGVCGGLAAYFGVDANIVRLATLFLFLVTGLVPVTMLYVAAAILVPEDGDDQGVVAP